MHPRTRLRLTAKPPPTPLADLIYSNCTIKELRKSVKGRGGTAFHYNTKEQLERKLRRLDEKWNFRLLDLPAELRTIVYCELLRIDKEHGCVGNVKILRVSRLIYEETMPLLYGMNTLKFEISSRDGLHLQDMTLPSFLDQARDFFFSSNIREPSLLPKYGCLAIQYSRFPRATFHRIERLDVEVTIDSRTSNVRQLNRALLALANILGGSAALKTVDVRLLPSANCQALGTGMKGPWDLNDLLYPLAKLQSTDVESGSRKRIVRFHGFDHDKSRRGADGDIRESLASRIEAGTPFPVDAVGTLTNLRERSRGLAKLMDRYPPIDATFDVFLSALERAIGEDILTEIVDFGSDRMYCRNVKSLKQVFETNESRWRLCVFENMLEGLQSARTDTETKSGGHADDWISTQRAKFEESCDRRK